MPAPSSVVAICFGCCKFSAEPLLECGKCRRATYCDRTCQKTHHKQHKSACGSADWAKLLIVPHEHLDLLLPLYAANPERLAWVQAKSAQDDRCSVLATWTGEAFLSATFFNRATVSGKQVYLLREFVVDPATPTFAVVLLRQFRSMCCFLETERPWSHFLYVVAQTRLVQTACRAVGFRRLNKFMCGKIK